MLSNLVVLGATGIIGYGCYLLTTESKMVKIFDECVRLESYDLNFVSKLSDLPQDKQIILTGNVLHSNTQLKALTQPEQEVVYNELVPVNQQVPDSETDFMYLSRLNRTLDFNVGEPNDVNKQLKMNFNPRGIMFFNPFIVGQEITTIPPSSLYHKLLLATKKYSLTEFALIPNSSFVFIGSVSQNAHITPATTNTGNNLPQFKFTPRIIMSNGKDSLLQHLDRYLVKIHDKGIKYLSIGSGILALHMVVTKIIFTTPKSRALPE